MQPEDRNTQFGKVTTTQEIIIESSNALFAKLSREQLVAVNKDLKSRVEKLEKQSSGSIPSGAKCSEKPSALEDLVKKASDNLDLVKAGIDLRKDNDHWDCLASVKQTEARQLEDEIASRNEAPFHLKNHEATVERRVSDLNAQAHDMKTLLKDNTGIQAALKASKQERAQAKSWLNNGEVEIITRFPDINFVRRSTTKLEGLPESLEDKIRQGFARNNGVKRRKTGK